MSKLNVVIVEDEFLTFRRLTKFFKDLGFNVLLESKNKAVDNYDDAVRLIKDTPPNLAVLDISINGNRDGLDLAHYIKQSFNIPVILFTSYSTSVYHHRAGQIRGHFILKQKPVSWDQLKATVETLMPDIIKGIDDGLRKQRLLNVKTINHQSSDTAARNKEAELVEEALVIHWQDLLYASIIGPNKTKVKNEVFLYTKTGQIYLFRSSLDILEKEYLPYYFGRPNQSNLLNIPCITRILVRRQECFIDKQCFDIKREYKEKFYTKLEYHLGKIH